MLSSTLGTRQNVHVVFLLSLQTLELIRPVEGVSASKVQKEFVVYNILVTSEQMTAALSKYPNLPTEVKQLADTCLSV